MNLDKSFDLRAKKLFSSRCVEVRWNLTQSGACYVKYNVILKDASRANLLSLTGYQIRRLRTCNALIFDSVNDVQLNVSFKNRFTVVTTKVSGSTSGTSLGFLENSKFGSIEVGSGWLMINVFLLVPNLHVKDLSCLIKLQMPTP